jgi:DNA-binding NarL/FixJ family response regulator
MKEIRIVMVDDHGLFRESLGRLLESTTDFRIVGRCGGASEAIELLSRTQADVVLLDYDLGEETALPLLRELLSRRKDLRILMVPGSSSSTTIRTT